MSDYTFSFDYHDYKVLVKVLSYTKGTNYHIHSASMEPNDPEEIEYELYDEDGNRQTYLECVISERVVLNAYDPYRRYDEDYYEM